MIKSVNAELLTQERFLLAHFPISVIIPAETSDLQLEKSTWKACVVLCIICAASQVKRDAVCLLVKNFLCWGGETF